MSESLPQVEIYRPPEQNEVAPVEDRQLKAFSSKSENESVDYLKLIDTVEQKVERVKERQHEMVKCSKCDHEEPANKMKVWFL